MGASEAGLGRAARDDRRTATPSRTRWLVLAAVATAQFLSVLDGLIVSVALPSIGRDLELSSIELQWALNAYTIPFASLLLLGGRLADVIGRRRAFLLGLALLAIGSLVGGLGISAPLLFAGRALQGVGAAISLPAALALVVATFEEGPERTRALAVLALGGGLAMVSAGLIGGVLTQALGWEWVLLINLPIVAFAALLGRVGMPGVQEGNGARSFDLTGALLGMSALTLLVYAAVQAQEVGLAAVGTLLPLVAAIALAIVFVVVQRRSPAPLLRLGLLREGNVGGANLLAILFSTGFIAPLFLGTIYLQDVLGFDALRAGLAFLPLSVLVVVCNPVVARVTARFGVASVAAFGFALVSFAFLLISMASGGAYVSQILPGFVLTGIGVTAAYIPLSVAAVAGVSTDEAGVASGVFNTSQQVGGAVLLAVLAAVATAVSRQAIDAGVPEADALATGFRWGFRLAAGINLLAAIGAATLLRAPGQPAGDPVGATAADGR
jgi:EmrB/QacA subfamily drug resistance transporter